MNYFVLCICCIVILCLPACQTAPTPQAPPLSAPTFTQTSISELPTPIPSTPNTVRTPVPRMTPIGTTIPFETLSLNEGYGVNLGLQTEVELLLLTGKEQIEAVKLMVSSEDFAKLQQVDYTAVTIIALFRGYQGSGNSPVVITDVTQNDDQLTVYAEFWNSGIAPATITYPYHLVKAAKADLSLSQADLVLEPFYLTPTPPSD